MKIEWKITPRDVKLLLLLAVCGLAFCYYYFGVRPLTESIDSLTMERDDLEMRQQQMEMRIATIPTYEEAVKNNALKLSKLQESFFDLQTNEQISAYLTDIFVGNRMSILETTIRDPQALNIEPYSLSRRMLLYTLSGDSESSDSSANSSQTGGADVRDGLSEGAGAHSGTVAAEDEKEQISLATANVFSCGVTISAIGTKRQALAVLDLLSEKDGLRVTSFSISDVTQQIGSKEHVRYLTRKRLELNLVIYMCIK